MLMSAAYGVNRPPQAAWGIKQTIPSSRGKMINMSIQSARKWFSADKAALVPRHHTDERIFHTQRGVAPNVLCATLTGRSSAVAHLIPVGRSYIL